MECSVYGACGGDDGVEDGGGRFTVADVRRPGTTRLIQHQRTQPADTDTNILPTIKQVQS